MTQYSKDIAALTGPILVTGASGFVGANLFRMLLAERNDVYAVVRQKKGWRLVDIADEHVIEADLNDRNAVKALVNWIEPKTIFDCKAYGAYSFEKDAYLIHQTNFLSVVNLLEEVGSTINAYIHAGSSSEYGENCSAPDEDDPRKPNSHYALSKSAVADYISYSGKSRSIPCLNLRLYSVYGELEDTSRLIPNVLFRALEGGYPPFVNPDISRDFVYIEDVCYAFISAASRMNVRMHGESVNIGTGHKTTIRDLALIVKKLFDLETVPEFSNMEDRNWDLKDWYANPARAKALFGWTAQIDLETGLQKTVSWVKKLDQEELKTLSKLNDSDRKRSISAIVACYKDAEAIHYMHQRLTDTFRKLKIDYEIIFVNDCSPDNSAGVIEKISKDDPHVLGINHSRNFGSQMAFRSGMELSTKEAVVLLDGDLQDPPELIEQFYKKWILGYDVVFGRRVRREMSRRWEFLYKLFYRIFSAFSYIHIPRDAGDFSLIDKSVVKWMLKFPERDLFVRGVRAYVGFKQVGVDYVRPERMFGVSTNNFFKNLSWAKKGIFAYSYAPLSMLTAAGTILLIVTFLFGIGIGVARILYPETSPRGFSTILISVLFFGSINLFGIGLLGEYISKIMTEVKRRPRLIRVALIRNGVTSRQHSNQ